MITYTIEQPEKEGDEPIIVKTGHEAKFTMSFIQANLKEAKKHHTELTSQIKIESSKMENIEHFHEIVHALSDEDMTSIALYIEAKNMRVACENKLVEIDKMIADGVAQIAEIEKQTGVKLPE